MLGFWEKLKASKTISDSKTNLYDRLREKFPEHEEDTLVEIACIAGLLARVAYVDFEIHDGEQERIRQVLKDWTSFSEEEVGQISELAIDEIKELAGVENHLYSHHLRPYLNKDQRFQIIRALFAVAASDGEVDNFESEEIRLIAKGLELFDQHFLAARAEVRDKLKSLKG